MKSITGRFVKALAVASASLVVAGLCFSSAASASPSAQEGQPSGTVAWSNSASRNGSGVHPLYWVFDACEGGFVVSNVNSSNTFMWGGEQSCTSPSPQTLMIRLINQTNGNIVGEPSDMWDSDQGYIHITEHCQSNKKTLYKEFAYGTANGVEMQPYPAEKGFYLNCYVAGSPGGGCDATTLPEVDQTAPAVKAGSAVSEPASHPC